MAKCPFCEQPLPPEAEVCPHANCGLILPTGYLEVCRHRPLLDVVIAGYSGHGKSEFLLSLFLTLNGLEQRIEGAHLNLDQRTEEILREYLYRDQDGRAVGNTVKGLAQHLVIGVRSVPPLADRFVRLYDTHGEVYKTRQDIAGEVPRLSTADAVWLIHSPHNQLNGRPEETLPSLLDAVHAAFQAANAVPTADRKRDLVVVFSKADKLRNQLPPELLKHLDMDPFYGVSLPGVWDGRKVDMGDYLDRAGNASDTILALARAIVPQVTSFINKAKAMHYTVSFALVSATGQDPQISNGVQRFAQRNPVRVIDPLFLTLEAADREPRKPSAVLILDGETRGLDALGQALHDLAAVTTYRLGQLGVVGLPGQVVTGPNPSPGPRLVGPILDTLPASSRAIVIANGPVLDLADYLKADWAGRLAVVRLDADAGNERWPKRVPYRPDDDARVAARRLLALIHPTLTPSS